MGNKFGRNYELSIEVLNGSSVGGIPSKDTITIKLPFTIEFDITRNTLTSANVCQIRLYNLSQLNRNRIYFNAYDQGNFRGIQLRAGYGTNLPTIFSGNISQAWSVREGVNFITQIECYDGGFAFVNGNIDISFPAGTALKDVIRAIMLTLPNISVGAIGDFPGTLSRGNTYSGNPCQILSEITGGGFFIDNGKAYALTSNQYIPDDLSSIVQINSQTGLLGTPVLEQTIARFEMLFEPSLNVGRLVKVDSSTNKIFNRNYKITSVKHRGMISGVVAGSVVTNGEFFFDKALGPA